MKYNVERSVITMSVGELCARAFLPFHLDLRAGAWKKSAERAEMGRKLHAKLQAKAGAGYEAEVSFCNTTMYNGICYEVSGRADGVMRGEPSMIEEIKTVGGRGFEGGPSLIHEAQAMCYAYFLCREIECSQVEVRLTLCRAEDEKTKTYQRICSSKELQRYYYDLLSRVAFRAEHLKDRGLNRLPSVNSGRFPYSSVREGQDIMIKECYRAIRGSKRLFIEAPTGTGKTVSTIFPALRALGNKKCDKVFYLTPKQTTAIAAKECIELFTKNN